MSLGEKNFRAEISDFFFVMVVALVVVVVVVGAGKNDDDDDNDKEFDLYSICSNFCLPMTYLEKFLRQPFFTSTAPGIFSGILPPPFYPSSQTQEFRPLSPPANYT